MSTVEQHIQAQFARLTGNLALGVRQRREAAQLTVEQAASRARWTRRRWEGLERGSASVTVDDLATIAAVFGCDPAELASGSTAPPSTTTARV